jgi:hypothetical protein
MRALRFYRSTLTIGLAAFSVMQARSAGAVGPSLTPTRPMAPLVGAMIQINAVARQPLKDFAR